MRASWIRFRIFDYIRVQKRNLRVIVHDVSIRETCGTLCRFAVLGVVVFIAMWLLGLYLNAELCVTKSRGIGVHSLGFAEFALSILGAVDAIPDLDGVRIAYAMMVRIVGAILIGGFITSFLCSLAERISQMALKGLLISPMYDHVLIVGVTSETDDLIRKLMEPDNEWEDLSRWYPFGHGKWSPDAKVKVLLYTSGDVEKIRAHMNAQLPRKLSSRISYVCGPMNLQRQQPERVSRRLSLMTVRQVFVLGDSGTRRFGDVDNLGIADVIGGILISRMQQRPVKWYGDLPVPIYVKMDRIPSFDLAKRMDFKLINPGIENSRSLEEVKAYFKPFSFNEGWARYLFGRPFTTSPLDFRPMARGDYVHLVVGPFNALAESLVVEAIRVAHFPNGKPTKITVIDMRPESENIFWSRRGEVRQLSDVVVDFRRGDFASPCVREMMEGEARNPCCLLTVAVCNPDSDESLETAISLPESIYMGYEDQSGNEPGACIAQREGYRKDPPQVLFFQDHVREFDIGANRRPQVRYRRLTPFGMQERSVQSWYFKGFPAMYLNAVYDWPLDVDGKNKLDELFSPRNEGRYEQLRADVDAFKAAWRTELLGDAAAGRPPTPQNIDVPEKVVLLLKILRFNDRMVEAFKAYAFRRLMKMDCSRMWANIYVEDSHMTVLRALGLSVRKPDRKVPLPSFTELSTHNYALFKAAVDDRGRVGAFERSLAMTEHNRWMADRALMGYRASRVGETRDSGFRIHDKMVPFDRLETIDINKDMASIAHIPLFLALDGLEMCRSEEREQVS